jgi:ribonucleoside-diphosphate reductase alpha chain
MVECGLAQTINGRNGVLTDNAEVVLKRRYLSKDREGNVLEDPDGMFRRVAHNLSQSDLQYGANDSERKETEKRFYDVMRRLEFLPNSPTLMNAGRELQQLSACFVLPVEDSLDAIFTKVKETALIHKSGGGTGFAFSRLRPEGDVVGSTGGVASGPVSFINAFDAATDVVKQGGTRRGANMGILHVTHPDIMAFIKSKEDGQRLSNFNISVAVTEDFMAKVEHGEDYDLVNPRTGQVCSRLNARDVFQRMTELAWRTGDPGIVFLDRINRDNPNPQLGDIESTNPCVTADTWVQTTDGPRQVGELVGVPFVAVVDGTAHDSDGRGFFRTGHKPVLRLTTNEGYSLRLTADHPVRKVERRTRYRTEWVWAAAGDLQPDDMIQLHDHRQPGEWNGKYRESEGYLIGLLLGDGTLKTDKAVLSAWPGGELADGSVERPGVASVMETALTATRILPRRSDFAGWTEVQGRGEYRLSLGAVRKLAIELGMTPGEKAVTPAIEQASSDFYRGFLRGLFDADGTVVGNQEKGVSVRLAQSDVDRLEGVQRMLLRMGIAARIYRERRPFGHRMLPDGKGGSRQYPVQSQHELVIANENIARFAELIGFADTEKQARLVGMLGDYKREMNRERFVATVANVVDDGYEDVFDTSIPGVNAFDANGFYVHNCGEQPLLPYESCNLGSLNLARMVRYAGDDVAIDWQRMAEVITTAVHMLDCVIDMNEYPIQEIAEMSRRTRRIGLGVMGWSDLLIQLGIRYDSAGALEVARQVMRFIKEEAHRASIELARVRGPFPEWERSAYNTGDNARPMRNSAPVTIAPTGTISIIAGASSGIEPLFALSYVRNVMDNTRLVEGNAYFEAVARHEGFYSTELMEQLAAVGSLEELDVPEWVKDVFRVSHDIDPKWHVRMQAAFQEYTDNAVSKTINFSHDATVADVAEAYQSAYTLGCKGITVYRDGSKAEQVLSTGATGEAATTVADSDTSEAETFKSRVPRGRPRQIHGITERVRTGHGNMYVTVNVDPDGLPFEVFGTMGKAGGCDAALLEAVSRLVSLALRAGIETDEVTRQLRGITCCPAWDDGVLVGSGPDAVALVLDNIMNGINSGGNPPAGVQLRLADDTETHGSNGQLPTGTNPAGFAQRCPECNGAVVNQEGCTTCYSCGWNKCE